MDSPLLYVFDADQGGKDLLVVYTFVMPELGYAGWQVRLSESTPTCRLLVLVSPTRNRNRNGESTTKALVFQASLMSQKLVLQG